MLLLAAVHGLIAWSPSLGVPLLPLTQRSHRATSPHACADAASADASADWIEMPLFDPLDDELPFPFPAPALMDGVTPHAAPVFRFTFDRPMYRRLMTVRKMPHPKVAPTDSSRRPPLAVQAAAASEDQLFGHCVLVDAASASIDSGSTLSLIPRGLAKVRPRPHTRTIPSVAHLRLLPPVAQEGAVGVAVRIVELEAPDPEEAERATTENGLEPPTTARCVGAFRFRVRRLVSSFPFATGAVEPFSDAAPKDEAEAARAAQLEEAVEAALGRLCALSASLESNGDDAGAAMAASMLSAPAELLASHQQRVLGSEYTSDVARWEHFSLALCSIVDLEFEDATEAIQTTSGARRLELLLLKLRDALGEVGALAALAEAADWRGGGEGAAADDGVAGAALGAALGGGRFSPIDIPVGDLAAADVDAAGGRGAEAMFSEIPEGTRLEYWWNEEWQWCGAAVVGPLKPSEGKMKHALRFDSDGSVEDCCLYFDDGGRRWRPLRPIEPYAED